MLFSAGQMLSRFISIGVLMAMARMLDKSELASYRQVFLAIHLMSTLMCLGINQGISYILPVEKIRVRGRIADAVFVLGLMGILYAIAIACGGNQWIAERFNNPKLAKLLLWMIPFMLVHLPGLIIDPVLVAIGQSKKAIVFEVSKQLVLGICTIIPLLLWQNLEAPLIGNMVAFVIMSVAGIRLMYRASGSESSNPYPSTTGIKELIFCSVPLAFAGLATALENQLDQIIVANLCSPLVFAEYSLGAKEIPLIGVITSSIMAILVVELRKSVAVDNLDRAIDLFRKCAVKSSIILLPAMLFFYVNAENFMIFMYTSEYTQSSIPFKIYLLTMPLRTVIFISLLTALGEQKKIMWCAVVSLILNGSLSVYLVGEYGSAAAAAWVTVGVMYLFSLPIYLKIIKNRSGKTFMAVIPLLHFLKIVLLWTPVVLLMVLVNNWMNTGPNIKLFLNLAIAGVYGAWRFNGELYSFDQLKKRFIKR